MDSEDMGWVCIVAIVVTGILLLCVIGTVASELDREHELAMASCNVAEISDD